MRAVHALWLASRINKCIYRLILMIVQCVVQASRVWCAPHSQLVFATCTIYSVSMCQPCAQEQVPIRKFVDIAIHVYILYYKYGCVCVCFRQYFVVDQKLKPITDAIGSLYNIIYLRMGRVKACELPHLGRTIANAVDNQKKAIIWHGCVFIRPAPIANTSIRCAVCTVRVCVCVCVLCKTTIECPIDQNHTCLARRAERIEMHVAMLPSPILRSPQPNNLFRSVARRAGNLFSSYIVTFSPIYCVQLCPS